MCNIATLFSIKTILTETENILFINSFLTILSQKFFLTIVNYLKCFAWKRACPISLELQHCVKGVQIRSFSSPYFPVFSPNTGKYGPEKTPYLDILYAVQMSQS